MPPVCLDLAAFACFSSVLWGWRGGRVAGETDGERLSRGGGRGGGKEEEEKKEGEEQGKRAQDRRRRIRIG
jgi:hypothetical protein